MMVVEPKVRGFICTTAHPQGCAAEVNKAIAYVKSQPKLTQGPKRVLIIGASTGYGLASRIVATYAADASTIGVFFEKPAKGRRCASAGWYNTAALEQAAIKEGHQAISLNGDAFSHAMKQQVIDAVKTHWPSGIDLLIYSVASPRRQDPDSDTVYKSCLKTLGQQYHNKTVNIHTGKMSEAEVTVASEQEVNDTIAVMGGDDWRQWIDVLLEAGCCSEGMTSLAYSYIGPELTFPLYREGTIGAAKKHLEQTAHELNQTLAEQVNGHAYISINKAVVTQAAAAIPVVPLYSSILYKIMQQHGLHEGCIEQMQRLFSSKLYAAQGPVLDEQQLIRLDDWEMKSKIQQAVAKSWQEINEENLDNHADLATYRQDFMHLFGFEVADVDYTQAVEVEVEIPSIVHDKAEN